MPDIFDIPDDEEDGEPYLNFTYDPTTDQIYYQIRMADMDAPYEMECDMCGKQNNPRWRPGGSYMCSTCWQVWNS